MKVSCVFYNPDTKQFEYSKELIDFDTVEETDYDHVAKTYYHASRFLDRADYNLEIGYAEEVCNKFNHQLKVYPYVETEDSIVICKDCKLLFLLSVKEKDWYRAKQFSMPCRCKPCRDKRKQSRES